MTKRLAVGDVRGGATPVIALLCVTLLFAVTYSVTIGRYDIGMWDVWRILWDNIVPRSDPPWTDVQESVVELVRMPRILAALLIGAGLAVSGAALQGLFRNPLVDPGIIGVTSGAAFGGTLAILLVGGGYLVLSAAFAFGIASVLVVTFLASVKGRTSVLTLVLAGVIVSAFFEAAISIIKLLADPHQKLPAITYWLMGSIASTSYRDLALMAVAIVPASIVIFLLRYQINILSLGEDKARALGSPIAAGPLDDFSRRGVHLRRRRRNVGHRRLGRPCHPACGPRAGRGRSRADAARLGVGGRDLHAARRQSGAHRHDLGDPDRHHHRADRRALLRGDPAPAALSERLGQ